ncbi:MAG: 8-oxoguanine deaminase [Chloroflexi bacterium]|nr:8-oxoguanine deaminase [Ardenticatenaceae bacterium]MBL1129221.1 8-oxoguanine deaminase [Chloroflexota bacterium]NOG35296.1 8-oxoguanine deaminase [Chloroflexota bacterium]GIK58591.1 MAG: 8-oxoguanine deaminase [Chloroflexota bacterium]
MTTLLVRNARLLITMNDAGEKILDGALFVRDNVIEWVGDTAVLPPHYHTADQIIDATDQVVLPGLVNTHHHLYQTLTRALAPNSGLFDWLKTLYPIWARMDGEAVYISALVGMAELILSGCTTASDHLYLFPNGAKLDDEIRAAQEIGLRFHAARGSMSLGESDGGLPPDSVVEDEEAILRDCRRVIEQFHDPNPLAMTRIVVAPCSPFSVTPDLMRESARLARSYGVTLHTHLAETKDEELFCLETFGWRPAAYAEQLEWVGDDVWWAHAVHVNAAEIGLMARTGTGAAHCPCSNMRLASGIAPVRQWLDHGVRVGLGVDGSASNDGSHMLNEARQALLLQRVLNQADTLKVEEALWLATRGGAAVLKRDDIGQLAVGKAADIIAYDLNRLAYAGAQHDPPAALLFCAPPPVTWSVINGRVVVSDGVLQTIDLEPVIRRHNQISQRLINNETS